MTFHQRALHCMGCQAVARAINGPFYKEKNEMCRSLQFSGVGACPLESAKSLEADTPILNNLTVTPLFFPSKNENDVHVLVADIFLG